MAFPITFEGDLVDVFFEDVLCNVLSGLFSGWLRFWHPEGVAFACRVVVVVTIAGGVGGAPCVRRRGSVCLPSRSPLSRGYRQADVSLSNIRTALRGNLRSKQSIMICGVSDLDVTFLTNVFAVSVRVSALWAASCFALPRAGVDIQSPPRIIHCTAGSTHKDVVTVAPGW